MADMNDSDLDIDTSIECSKRFHTLQLNETANSFIESVPFDSASDHESDELNRSRRESDCNHESERNGHLTGIGKDSFSLTSFLLKYSQNSEHSLHAGEDVTRSSYGGHAPMPLSAQMRNTILEAYNQAEAGGSELAELVTKLHQILESQDKSIKHLQLTLADKGNQENIRQFEYDCMMTELAELREEVKDHRERDRNISPPTDLTSFMTLPPECSGTFPTEIVRPVSVRSQEVQTSFLEVPRTDTSVQIEIPTSDNSTQYMNLVPPLDFSSQAGYEHVDCSTQVVLDHANTSAQAGSGLQTLDTSAQTLTVQTSDMSSQSLAIPTNLDISLQTQFPNLEAEAVQKKCKLFQNTIDNLRKELTSVKDSLSSADPAQFNEIIKSVQSLCTEQEMKMNRLKQNYARDLDAQNQIQIQLKVDLEALRQQKEEVSRAAAEEIADLKVKMAQLEDSRKSAERRLVSFSSRLSPEGSELDVDTSLTDSAANNYNGGSASEHYQVSRTKMEYLTITPPVCIDDGDVLEGRGSSDVPISVVEDLKLQLSVLEKKYDVNRRYLEEQTAERELERDEFHRNMEDLQLQLEELRKDKDRLDEIISNQKLEMDDYDVRLKDATEYEQELVGKAEKVEEELKSAVDKIYELREIIRDLEEQIDSTTVNVEELKDRNQVLEEALERAEAIRKEQLEEGMNSSEDTYVTATSELHEELFTQVHDLASRLEAKLNEMDNFKWSSRPASSCSGAISVSTEDVSVRELSYFNKDKGREITAVDLADGLRRLDTHFESFVRFEEVIMKKLRDTEMRFEQARKRHDELESEKLASQETMKDQILKISDLQSRLDQLRFEPSPNAVTLTGLRARVKSLSEDLEQHKGQLQLKTMEVQDMAEKLAATQALLQKYTTAPKRESVQVRKPTASVYVQTDKKQPTADLQNSFVQTDSLPVRPKPKSTYEIGVQTQPLILEPGADYFTHPHEVLDISTIPGEHNPIHSTPNEGIQLRSKRGFRTLVESDFDKNRSPETFRNVQSTRIERLSTVSELNRTLESDEHLKDVLSLGQQDYPANEPGADGLTGFVEVDDPVEVLGPFAGDQPSPSAPPMPGSTPTNGGQGGGGNAGPVAPGAGGSSPSPSYGALDRTFSDVPGSSDPAEAEMLERTNDPAMGRSMHGPSTADPGAQNISGTGTASTSQNMLNPSQRAPLPSGKMHPAAERAANGMSRTDMPNIPGMVFGPNDRMASSNDPTSTRAQLPHGSLSQSALPNQPPKKTSPCIPSDCVQANLLEQIEALKEKNHRLAAQLEMSQSFLEKQQEMLAAATIAKAQQPAPNVAVSPPQLQEAAASVTPPPKAQPVAPAPPSPPGPPSPPPPFFAAPPATECVPTTPEQEVLLKQVQQLRQERDELERRLNQGQGETDAGRTETERQIKEASTLVSRLEREKSGLEAKLRSLQANNDFRGRQLEDFMHMMESQRNNLKCEISRRTKELETEIMKKNALQTKFQESMRSLEQQKQVDLQTRLENERLKSNLERLQSQLGSQFRPSSANNMNAGSHCIEMYLRTKSYRKALTWQKKYLTTVIQGYKVLLNMTGAGFEHPDILQKEVLINPSSVGLLNRQSPITRFRIYVKMVLAINRMKFMVRRWRDRPHCHAYRDANKAVTQLTRVESCPNSDLRNNGLRDSASDSPRRSLTLSPALSLASLQGFDVSECETVLSQYMRRIQVLEKEVGQVLHRAPDPVAY